VEVVEAAVAACATSVVATGGGGEEAEAEAASVRAEHGSLTPVGVEQLCEAVVKGASVALAAAGSR
jgi:hypothetical protein